MKILDKTKKNEQEADVMIGVLNFNNMLPVTESVLSEIDIKIYKEDSQKVVKHKRLLKKQLDWCQGNEKEILSHANKLYSLITKQPEKNRDLTRRCCDFKKLEKVLERWTEKGSMLDKGTYKKKAPHYTKVSLENSLLKRKDQNINDHKQQRHVDKKRKGIDDL